MTDPAQASPEQMEKRIVELEADNTYLAKTLIEMGEKVTLYVDELEDEGDRIYFGSTNHAEYLRDLCETVFEERVFRNDRFEKPAKGRDLYAEMGELREAKAQSDQQQVELLAHAEAMAGEARLAQFFRDERPDLGFEGDVEGWSPVEAAMQFLRRQPVVTQSTVARITQVLRQELRSQDGANLDLEKIAQAILTALREFQGGNRG